MNQLCTFSLRTFTRSTTRSLKEIGDKPGVQDRHFWLAEYTASMPHSSTRTGVPPSEVTASIMVSAPCLRAISASDLASDATPVEVSACTKASTLVSGLALNASSTFCRLTGVPQRSSTTTATPPQRCTFSIMRPPNTPLRQTMTLSPGLTMLTKHISMPTEPGPETGKVSSLLVWKA